MINIISEPADQTSVYNPNIWLIDSTNRSKDGFRYLAKVFKTNRATTETLTLVKTIKILPRPDGKGEFDLSFFLQNQTYFKREAENGIFIKNKGLRFDYRIEFGEEYYDSWKYYDTEFLSGSGGKTKAVGNSAPPFVAGDVVQITPNNPTLFPLFNGVQLVQDVVGNDVYFDVPFSSTPANGGSLWYADGRKLTVWDNSKTVVKTVYRAKIDFEKWTKNNFKDNYFADGNGLKKLPINTVENFLFKEGQIFWIPIYSNFANPKIQIESSSTMWAIVPSGYNDKNNACYFRVGFMDEDFTVQLFDNNENEVTEKISYKLDDRCSPNDLFLMYEDKFGALNSWAFSGFSEKRVSVNKTEYNKPLNFTDTGEYENEINRTGYTIADVSSSTEITLHGYSFPRKQDLLFEDLLKSKVHILHDAKNNTFRRCTLVDGSATFLDEKRTGLRRRNITIKLANE